MKRFLSVFIMGMVAIGTWAACPVNPGSISTASQTICSGTNPGTISASAASGGIGSIHYAWLVSTNGTTYSIASGTNTNQSYVIPSALTQTTYYKRLAIDLSGSCATQETSPVKFTVTTATNISSNPSNSTICAGNNTSFSVTSTGSGLTYQWQEDKGSGYSDLSDGGVYINTSTATLILAATSAAFDGYEYRCIVGSTACTDETSTTATLTVQTAPAITTSPSNTTECETSSASFTVAATGSSLTFQWQEDNGGGFSNLSNGGIYSNVDASTLSISSVSTGMSGYDYRCVVSGACTPSATSGSAKLTVQELPSISAQPSDDVICPGGNATFNVTASGTSLTFRWQEDDGGGFSNIANGGVYGGATTNTLFLTGAGSGLDQYDYRCVVSGACTPSVTSNSVTLDVEAAPSITSNPTNSTICAGNNTSFTVAASGDGLTFQWQEDDGGGFSNLANGGIYGGVTSATLLLTAAGSGNDGYDYRCVVSGNCTPSATSSSAELTVQTAAAVTSNPSNSTICAGNNTSFTVATTGSSLTFQWQEDDGGGFSDLADGGVYSNTDAASLSITGATAGIDGYKYRCVVDNSACNSTTSTDATLSVETAPSVTSSPTNSTICAGNNTSFTVAASGDGLTFQWQEDDGGGFSNLANGGIYGGVTSATLLLTAAGSGNDGYDYRCVVSGNCTPSATSSSAELTVQTAAAVTSNPSNSTICAGNNTSFTVATTGSSLTFQWQEDDGGGFSDLADGGVYSNTDAASLSITGATAGMDGYKYRCVVDNSACNSTTSTDATLSVETAPSVTSSPTNSTICAGNNTSFTVAASGDGLTFQWQEDDGGGFSNLANGGIYGGVTSATLLLTAAGSGNDGYDYRCVVSGNCTPSATSSSAELTVQTAATVTSNPSNSTICAGNNTSFTVAATGSSLTFQWQEDDGGGFSDLADGGVYSNTDAASLSITGATAGMDGYKYRCVVDNSACNSTTSTDATLSVETAPSITSNPSAAGVCSGNNTSFTVAATGDGLTFQWQEDDGGGFSDLANGGIYGGVTSNTLLLTGVGTGINGYDYRCVISGNCTPSATSSSATLTVQTSASITTSPSNSTICAGSNTTFTVVGGGPSLTFQWQEDKGSGFNNLANGGVYGNVATATLSITAATAGMDGYKYQCVVTNACNSLTSSDASLSIETAPSVTSNPSDETICSGSNASFNVTASGDGLTFQWQEDQGSGFSNLSNGGLYGGATTSSLALTGVGLANDGYDYRCVVSGTCSPSATSSSANLDVGSGNTITSNPSDQTECVGETASFTITATGAGLGYQWQEDKGSGFGNISGGGQFSGTTTNKLDISSVTSTMNGYDYRCIVSGSCGSDKTSSSGNLEVETSPSITTSPSNDSGCPGDAASFTVAATGSNLSFQWQEDQGSGYSNLANAGVYNGVSTSILSISSITGFDGYTYRCEVTNNSCPAATTAAASLSVGSAPSITVQPSNLTECVSDNALFSVTATGTSLTFQWQENGGSGFGNISNGGQYSGATSSSLTISTLTAGNSGKDYRCIISGTCTPSVTSNNAELVVETAPSIDKDPANAIICLTSNAIFVVEASGSALGYQWQEDQGSGFANLSDDATYSGSDNDTLTITSPALTMSGNSYRCVVTNTSCPSATTTSADLTVQTAPTITAQPSSDIICDGTNSSFSVTATGTSLTFQWQEDQGSGFANLSNGGVYGGVNTSTLSLTSAGTTLSGNDYRCVVDNTACSEVNSNSVSLTVQAEPTVTTSPSNQTVCSGGNTNFTVSTTGSSLTFQWQEDKGSGFANLSNSGIYSGTSTSTLSLSSVTTSEDGYDYRCVVDNSTCSPDISNSASLTVETAPSISSSPSNSTICAGSNTGFSVATAGSNLTFQWQEDQGSGFANLSNGGVYGNVTTSSLSITSATTGMDGYDYRCVVTGSCTPSQTSSSAELTVQTAPTISSQPNAATTCSGSNAKFSVTASGSALSYQWQEDQGSGYANISNGGIYSGADTDELSLTSVPVGNDGYKYRLVISNSTCSALNSNEVTLSVQGQPGFSKNPANATVCETSNASFSVTTTGTSLTYQWQEDQGSGFTDLANGGIYGGISTTTLLLTGVPAGNDGYKYRCEIENSACGTEVSTDGELTVELAPSITTQPSDDQICETTNASFTIAATGAGVTYQWQEDQGSGFANLTNGGVYGGVTSTALAITAAPSTMNGYDYRCIVSGNCTPSVTSDTVNLEVETSPAISSNPSAVSICSGTNTSFSITATGSNLSFQWQEDQGSGFADISNGGIYSGATISTLNLTGVPASNDGFDYRCVVSNNTCSDATSSSADVTILANPAVTVSPSDDITCIASGASFTVTGSGAGIGYQWQEDQGSGFSDISNGGIYSGANTASFSISSATAAMDGYLYRCVVSGTCTPSVNSNSAELTVQTPPSVTTEPTDISQCEGTGSSFSIVATGSTLSFQWQEDDGSGFSDLADGGTYSGTDKSTLALSNIPTSINGYSYRCVVSNATCDNDTSAVVKATVLAKSSEVTLVTPSKNPICNGESLTLTGSGGTVGAGSTIEWYTGPNGTGTNFASGTGPISLSPSDSTTIYLRREGTCNTTNDFSYDINVYHKPVALFGADATCEGKLTEFRDSTTVDYDTIQSYLWDLGDASISRLKNVNHRYSSKGVYSVELIVTSGLGCKDTFQSSVSIYDQPTADFTVTNACLGENSTFTDKSSLGSGTLTHAWDFGDGSGSATTQNSSYVYGTSGGFTAKLVVTSSDGCMDSVTKSSTIYALPFADFDFDDECLGDSTRFLNKGRTTSGNMTHVWDFDDGSATSTNSDPAHLYAASGDYDVMLITTSDKGCKDTIERTVETFPLPTAAFSANTVCIGQAVTFTNSSTSPTGSKLTHSWDFDDGTSSSSNAPNHVYGTSKIYNVTLLTTSAEGCEDDSTLAVDVKDLPNVSFAATAVCDGFATTFVNNSTAPGSATFTGFEWDFGGGDTSKRTSPIYAFGNAGSFDVKLRALTTDGCLDSVTQVVKVNPKPTANFRSTDVCLVDSAKFQNLSSISSGSYTIEWLFGDGQTSTIANPGHKFASAGTYGVKLRITSGQQCKDSIVQKLEIFAMPSPAFAANPECDGDAIQFTNQTGVKTGTRYIWDFGDGVSSSTETPDHIYPKSGTYAATLTATTANGCTETTAASNIQVYPRIKLGYNANPECDGDTIRFLNQSTLSSGLSFYGWRFGDGDSVVSRNTAHLYDTFGVYNVTLFGITDNLCLDSLKGTIEVFPQPKARYSVKGICDESLATFVNSSIIPGDPRVFYTWDFGDGFGSNSTAPGHQYVGDGTYTTSMTVSTDDGCTDSDTKDINVWRNPKADFTVLDVCFGADAIFQGLDDPSVKIDNWEWVFGDGIGSANNVQTPSYFYFAAGVYEVQLKITTDSGCTGVTSQKVEIFPRPQASFTSHDTCDGFDVKFVNTSIIDKGKLTYLWEMGDGAELTTVNPIYKYDTDGKYPVKLVATSTDGCVDTATVDSVTIHPLPDASITSSIGGFAFCDGDSAVLEVPEVAGNSYSWSDSKATFNTTAKTQGLYSVTVTTPFGCETKNQEVVTVWSNPIAIALRQDSVISKGYNTSLEGLGGVFYTWSPAASLDNPSLSKPKATPEESTTYTLLVEDENGCQDTDSIRVFVNEDYRVEPNKVVTPNGDGINDFWVIDNITTYPDCEVYVTNRWGQMVFQSNNYQNTWDGTFNSEGGGKLPPGPYQYAIKCSNGRIYTGTVNIIYAQQNN